MSNYETPKESLEACLKVWEYLAEHPEELYKANVYNYLGMKADKFHCAACEYTTQFTDDRHVIDCRHCPIWPAADETDAENFKCEQIGSPYENWMESHYIDTQLRADSAKKMVILIQACIDNL